MILFGKPMLYFILGEQASTAAEETVYVRPGGGRETSEWAQEYMRVIWEVPRSAITDKVLSLKYRPKHLGAIYVLRNLYDMF